MAELPSEPSNDPASPFHSVGKILPDNVEVGAIPHDTRVVKALDLMIENKFSQMPVMDGDEYKGVFSLWSFARLAKETSGTTSVNLLEVEVQEAVESIPGISVHDSIYDLLEFLEKHEAVVVDSPKGIQAIATTWDLLDYFFRVAHPYVLIGEIELALRGIISRCASDNISEAGTRALEHKYTPRPVPRLQEMSFDDYRAIVATKENWTLFEAVLGKNRNLVLSKLENIRKIRNEAFHFRAGPSVAQYDALRTHRDRMLAKERLA
jgi:CBS domain-containing protein